MHSYGLQVRMVEGPQCHRVANVHRKVLKGHAFKAISPNQRFTEGDNLEVVWPDIAKCFRSTEVILSNELCVSTFFSKQRYAHQVFQYLQIYIQTICLAAFP